MQAKQNLTFCLQWNFWWNSILWWTSSGTSGTFFDIICENYRTYLLVSSPNILREIRVYHTLATVFLFEVQGAHNPSDPGWWYDCVTWLILGARTWRMECQTVMTGLSNGSLEPHGTSWFFLQASAIAELHPLVVDFAEDPLGSRQVNEGNVGLTFISRCWSFSSKMTYRETAKASMFFLKIGFMHWLPVPPISKLFSVARSRFSTCGFLPHRWRKQSRCELMYTPNEPPTRGQATPCNTVWFSEVLKREKYKHDLCLCAFGEKHLARFYQGTSLSNVLVHQVSLSGSDHLWQLFPQKTLSSQVWYRYCVEFSKIKWHIRYLTHVQGVIYKCILLFIKDFSHRDVFETHGFLWALLQNPQAKSLRTDNNRTKTFQGVEPKGIYKQDSRPKLQD